MDQPEIVKLDIDDPRWLDFITSRDDANIFHHPCWAKNLAECYGYVPFVLAVIGPDGHISAGIPIMEISSLVARKRWVSMPFSDHCAPLTESEDALHQLIDGLISSSSQCRVPFIELRSAYPPHDNFSAEVGQVLHTKHMDGKPEEIFENLPRKVRYCVRTTINRGVNVEMGTSRELLRRFYQLQIITRRRHGLPVQPWKYFELLGKNLLQKGFGYVLLANKDGKDLAGEVFLYYQNTVTMKYAASCTSSLKDIHPNHLLDWEVIRWGRANGYSVFDSGRSRVGDEGLRAYKTKWGFFENPLTYTHYGHHPIPSGNTTIMNIMCSIIHKSPLWVTRFSGELFYKLIG